MIRTTTTTTTQRRRAVSNLQQSTAVILFMLSLSMQSYHNVVAFSSSIISRRGIPNTLTSQQRGGVGVVQSILTRSTDRGRISSSSLYNLRTSSQDYIQQRRRLHNNKQQQIMMLWNYNIVNFYHQI